MDVSPLVWWLTIGITTAVLLFDVVVIGRRPHEPSRKEVSVALAVFVGMAVLFGIGDLVLRRAPVRHRVLRRLADRVLPLGRQPVHLPDHHEQVRRTAGSYQQSALLVGIVLALIMRGIFIAVGAAAINNFSWIFYIFGLFLVWTAWKLAKEGQEDEDDFEENRLIKFVERRFPATSEWHGTKILTKENGKRVITPMFIVILALGHDRPAVRARLDPGDLRPDQEPYIVLTANIFALMGLRQLYFLIGGLLERLVYLSYGLAFLLGFIGVKLILHALHENELPFINGGEHVEWAPDIPIWLSLAVIVGTLVVTTVASLAKTGCPRAASESA